MANRSMELKFNRARSQRREAAHMEGSKSAFIPVTSKVEVRRDGIIKTWEFWAAGNANAAGNGPRITRSKARKPSRIAYIN